MARSWLSESGYEVVFDREELEKAGLVPERIPAYVRLQNVNLRSILRFLLDRHAMAYVTIDDRIVVTTKGRAMWLRTIGNSGGTSDVPKALKSTDTARRRAAVFAAGQRPLPSDRNLTILLDLLDDPDRQVRFDAAFAIGEFSEAAKPAIPELMRVLQANDDTLRQAAATALAKIGLDAYPELMQAMSTADGAVLPAIVQALSDMRAEPKKVVPAVFEVWTKARVTGFGTFETAYAISRMDSKEVVPVVVEGLHHGEPGVRKLALSSLRFMGPSAVAAVEPVVDLLKDADPGIRRSATWVLESIGQEAKAAVSQLIHTIKNDRDIDVRIDAIRAIVEVGNGREVLDALCDALEHANNERLQRSVVVSLATILGGPSSPSRVRTALKDSDPSVRRSAAYALTEDSSSAFAITVEALLGAMKDEDSRVRRAAAWALGQFRSGTQIAIPTLIETSENDPDPDVRKTASEAAKRIRSGK